MATYNISLLLRTAASCAILAAATVLPLGGATPETQPPAPARQTVLGIRGSQFTINEKPVFLYGISYYGALGATPEFIRRDLDDIQRLGFNWIRVWATWSAFDNDVSAVDAEGRLRQPYFDRLKDLVSECDRRGMAVDVTLTRGERIGLPHLGSIEIHERTVQELVRGLQPLGNWYLDMANEHNLRAGSGHPANKEVSFEQLARLRNAAKAVDPARLVTASYCGDASEADLRKYVGEVRLDFLSPHRQRGRTSPAETATKTRQALAMMETIGRVVPVHYQEPFRRAFGPGWQPASEDYAADLKGAIDGGAAGWCFHNGDSRTAEGGRPRRSFDLREQRLFDQLDAEERKAVDRMAEVVRKGR